MIQTYSNLECIIRFYPNLNINDNHVRKSCARVHRQSNYKIDKAFGSRIVKRFKRLRDHLKLRTLGDLYLADKLDNADRRAAHAWILWDIDVEKNQ